MTGSILVLALILRLIFLNQSLWLDESIEALALMGKMGPILSYALSDFQPPLYHLIGIFWTNLAGYSEITLRTPSLISGLFTVFFVIKLASLLFGKRVGVIAGVLAATNPLLIYYSQEGRTYAMTTMFVTASFYFLFRLLKLKKRTPIKYLPYLVFTLGALWTSYLAWVVIGLQALYLLIKKEYKLFALTAFSFATLIFWLPSLLRSLGIGLSTANSSPAWGRVVGGISFKALGLTWVKMVIGRISFANKYLYAGIVVLLALLHSLIFKRLRSFSKIHPLFFFWLLSLPLIALISFFIPIYSYFRLLFIVPAYLILLSLGLAKFPRPSTTFLVIFSQLLFLGIFWFTPRFHREDWRALTNYLNTQQESVVAMPSLAQSAPLRYYNLTLPLSEPTEAIESSPTTIYYIKYVEDLFDSSGQGRRNFLISGYNTSRSLTYSGLQIDIYENTR